MTIRRQIIEILKNGEYSAMDLSKLLGIRIKEVYEHLAHAAKSTRSKNGLISTPAKCLDCGYIFRDRRRFTTPSRCPKCRSESVGSPMYGFTEE